MVGKGWEFRLDIKGIGELAESAEMAKLMTSVAGAIAQAAVGRFDGATYLVESYRTDRRAAGAVIVGENVVSEELQNGYLARAARGAGLNYTARRRR